MSYRLVFPNGDAEEREGSTPEVGFDVDGYGVDFVKAGDLAVVYLGLHYGQVELVKLVYSSWMTSPTALRWRRRLSSPTACGY